MRSLAKGTSSDCIFKLIKVLIDTQQKDFSKAVMGDTTAIEDIAEKLEANAKLFNDDEPRDGGSQFAAELKGESLEEGKEGGSYKVPAYVEDQIKSTKYVPSPKHKGLSEEFLRSKTGHRSAKFDFLLDAQKDYASFKPSNVHNTTTIADRMKTYGMKKEPEPLPQTNLTVTGTMDILATDDIGAYKDEAVIE